MSLFLLFLLLINPDILKTEFIYQKPKLSVLIDNSSSISYLNQDTIVNSIVDDFKAHQELSKKFDINYYSFGNQLQLTDRLTFDENQTRIEEPLKKVSEVVNQKNHAIVLISDGNQTFGNDYQYISLKTPVYPIVIGDTAQYEDLYISQINHNKYSFLNNQFPIEFFISYTGTRDVKKRFKIENSKGEVLYSKDLDLSKDHKSISFQMKLKAKKEGLNNFKAKIEHLKNEKNTTNNLKNFSIEILNKQSKILIVSSIHHPDIGMLKKSIEGDKQRKVDHIILKNKRLTLNYNDEIKAYIYNKYEELKNLKKADGQEYTKLRKWIVCASDLPFDNIKSLPFKKNKFSKFLRRVSNELDKELYGMKKVKEQILLFLNTKLMMPEISGCSLGLIGPPGVGKTTIARCLARILKWPFEQISFGGVSAAEFLKGHDFTYVGSGPGEIVRCMQKMKYKNGILFFDEYEKISENKSITSLLLHVTDFQQIHEVFYSQLP